MKRQSVDVASRHARGRGDGNALATLAKHVCSRPDHHRFAATARSMQEQAQAFRAWACLGVRVVGHRADDVLHRSTLSFCVRCCFWSVEQVESCLAALHRRESGAGCSGRHGLRSQVVDAASVPLSESVQDLEGVSVVLLVRTAVRPSVSKLAG